MSTFPASIQMTTLRCDDLEDNEWFENEDEIFIVITAVYPDGTSTSEKLPTASRYWDMAEGSKVQHITLWAPSQPVPDNQAVVVTVAVWDEDVSVSELLGNVRVLVTNKAGTPHYNYAPGTTTVREGCSKFGNLRFRLYGKGGIYRLYFKMVLNTTPGCGQPIRPPVDNEDARPQPPAGYDPPDYTDR